MEFLLPLTLTYWTLRERILPYIFGEAMSLIRSIKYSFITILGMSFANPCSAASFAQYFDLSLMGDGYFQPSSKDYTNGQLHGRFKLLGSEENYDVYFELGGGGLVGQERAENYFVIPQTYWHYKGLGAVEITVGRKIRTYSTLDEYWLLGDVQPLFRWDAVNPELQGLSGVFVDYKPNANVEMGLFATYLFVPTQGPSFSVIDGKLTSGNPWFSRPVDILNVSGAAFDLKYDIKTPEVSDVVFQPSWGTHILLKSADDAYWMRTAYFQKTKNELALPFEGTINIGTGDGDIAVHPQVAQHRVATLDLGYRGDSWAITASGLSESHTEFDVNQPTWIYPDYSDQYKVGLNILTKITSFHTLEFGGIRTFNNSIDVQGLGGGANLDIYSYRNQYDNAADVRITSVFAPRPHGFLFKTKFRWAYDYKAETSLVSADFTYMPIKNLSLFARTDLFGGQRDPGQVYNNLLVNYLNKDRGQVGVKYVF